jgi:hypothetical protein
MNMTQLRLELEKRALMHPAIQDALDLINKDHNEDEVFAYLSIKLIDRVEKLVAMCQSQTKVIKALEDISSLQKESLEDLKKLNHVLLEILSGVGSFLPATGELNILLARLKKMEKWDTLPP